MTAYDRFVETDWTAAYNSIGLAENSRNILARHTALGLKRPTRLQFGSLNAGSTFYSAKLSVYGKLLKADTQNHMYTYIDDDRIGKKPGESWNNLLSRYEDLLKCLQTVNGTLSPSKTRLGCATTVFYGREIGNGISRTARKNLAPIANMSKPQNVGDIRRVLGVFVQSKDYVKNYAQRTKCLSMLTRKNVKWH